MKRAATYVLILLVSFAYSYETLEYFSIIKDSDFHTEESSESEESSEKNERPLADDNIFNERHLHYRLISDPVDLGWISARHHSQSNNFLSNDYSHEVFSPPEVTV